MNFGSQILILNAVEFFAALNNTCISDRTIALLLPCLWICSSKTIVPADFLSHGIMTQTRRALLIHGLPCLSQPVTFMAMMRCARFTRHDSESL